jgi:glutamate/tyrosine decarboxylase-like PLP-dependent enzyme
MNRLGRAGYRDAIGRILAVKRRLIDGIGRIDGLRVVGRPACAHFFVAADGLDVFAVEEALDARGWALSRAHAPDSFQIWPGPQHAGVVDAFLAELADATAAVRASGRVARGRDAAYAR